MNEAEFRAAKVLIVDDDDLSQSVLEGVIRNIGCQSVWLASNSDGALQLAKAHQPDFVTLDIYMPETDGWAVLKKLRHACPQARIIMVTGSSLPNDFMKSLESHADGFCIKPVLPDLMRKAMHNAMNPH